MNDRHNFLRSERLGNVVLRAGQPPFETINDAIAPGEHDNGGIAKLLFRFEVTGNFIAVHLGEADVEDYQVGYAATSFTQRAEGFNTIGITDRLDAFASQAGFDDLPNNQGIVNDHYQFAHLFVLFLFSTLPTTSLRKIMALADYAATSCTRWSET